MLRVGEWSATALLLASFSASCGPNVRSVEAPNGSSREPGASASPDAAEKADDVEASLPPPALKGFPTVERPQIVTLEDGPAVCQAPRPDLAQVVSSLELPRGLDPEERTVLRSWLKEALSQELKQTKRHPSFRFVQGGFCSDALFCIELGDATTQLPIVARTLAAPSVSSFYAFRLETLQRLADEQTRASWWTMEALAHRALMESPSSSVGRARVLGFSPAQLDQRLREALGRGEWSVAGGSPDAVSELAAAWEDATDQWSAQASARASDPPDWNRHPLPVLLAHEAGERARALLAWPTSLGELHFRTAAEMMTGAAVRSSQVALDIGNEGALFSIRIEGPIEAVIEAASQVQRRWSELRQSAPAKEQFVRAEAQARAHARNAALDPRCFAGSTQSGPVADRRKAFLEVVKQTGEPALVYAGQEELLLPALPSKAQVARLKNDILVLTPHDGD